MAMEFKQTMKFSQQLVMTPQLQQAIKLLQLSRADLLEQIREELEQNPVLEMGDETVNADVPLNAPGERSLEADNTEIPQPTTPESAEKVEEFSADSKSQDVDWETFVNSSQFSEPRTKETRSTVTSDDLPSYENTLVRSEDLVDHLNEQLRLLKLNEAEQRIAMLIVGNLDDDGYLRLPGIEGDPLIRLANEADVSIEVAEKTIRRIQKLEPKGCAARHLEECLLVQLAAQPGESARTLSMIVKKYLKLLETSNLPAIAKEMKLPIQKIVAAVKLLTRLDPKPGRNYCGDAPQYITPDVYIHKIADQYVVVLNDDGVSKLHISDAYRTALKNGAMAPGQTKEFVQEKMRSAVWLIRSIYRRQKTIFRVTESIVKFQRGFLDKGPSFLKPLILRDVADDVGVDESTVSRVTSNKYVHTPQGIYELKFFFSSSIARTSGEDIASMAVKEHLKRLVDQEDPKAPYSDQRLVELLQAQNIEIARRTVAKYREMLGILPSSKRKKYF